MKSLRTPVHAYFLDLLLAARQRARLTQQQLADQLGKPQSFVAKYEGGERRLDVIEFLHLSQFLGIDAARTMRQLMTFEATQGAPAPGKAIQDKVAFGKSGPGKSTSGRTADIKSTSSRKESRGSRAGPGWRSDKDVSKK